MSRQTTPERLLELLQRHDGRVPFARLLTALWGQHCADTPENRTLLHNMVYEARRLLEPGDRIVTYRGVGYAMRPLHRAPPQRRHYAEEQATLVAGGDALRRARGEA